MSAALRRNDKLRNDVHNYASLIQFRLFAFCGRLMTTTQREKNPRKQPRQSRSRVTVDAILEATAQVSIAEGYDKLNTARIAERAGVSVGSLYQYFPNKNALIASLIDLHANRIAAVVEQARSESINLSFEAGIAALVEALLDKRRLAVELHKILIQQATAVGRAEETREASRKITLCFEWFLQTHKARLPNGYEPATSAIVMETTLEALTHRAILESLPDEILRQEIYRLLCGYFALDMRAFPV